AAAIEAIGRCLGCLASGGVVDQNRAAEAFLRELRAGKVGRVSFEEPGQDTEGTSPAAEQVGG
ncbi:MAG TPA: hypothetical protein VIH45_01975, partial [Desulfuromonadaceae bacterium]